jgi:hypothetical protein
MTAAVEGPRRTLRTVYDRASPDEQAHYLELMCHDPILGMAYLEALGLRERCTDGLSEED